MASRFETIAAVTVGASLSERRTGLPKASASTERSMAVNTASDGYRSDSARMDSNCTCPSV